MKIKLLFAWYDLWIGLFYDKNKNWLYVLPLPMIGIILKFPQKRYWLIGKSTNLIIGSTAASDLDYCLRVDNCYSKPYWAWNGETKPIFGIDFNED